MGCQIRISDRRRTMDQRDSQARRVLAHAANEFVALDHLLHRIWRLLQALPRSRVMQAGSGDFTPRAYRAMQVMPPWRYEYSLEAELQHTFMRHARLAAYSSIVARTASAYCMYRNHQPGYVTASDLIDAWCVSWDCTMPAISPAPSRPAALSC